MFVEIEPGLLQAYSRGEITRREIEDAMDATVSFGNLLSQLHAAQLPLPRIASDPHSIGVQLIRRLIERHASVG